MCFSKESVIFSQVFLVLHLFFYGVLYDGKKPFAKLMKPLILNYTTSWLIMEFFDYGLWRANIENRCYDLVTISGSYSAYGTALSMGLIVWHQRKLGYQGWDIKCFFMAGVLTFTYILIQSETENTMFPWAPLPMGPFRGKNAFGWTVNRNYWFSDDKWIMATILPLYAAPLVRAVYADTFRPQNRFGRCATQICMATLVGFIFSVAFSLAAWGSIWCFMTTFCLIIMDVHVYLGNQEKKDRIMKPFEMKKKESTIKKDQ